MKNIDKKKEYKIELHKIVLSKFLHKSLWILKSENQKLHTV